MQDEVVIRTNRPLLIIWVVAFALGVVLGIAIVINDYAKGATKSMWDGVFVTAVFLALLIYFIKELYERKVEIAISNEGVYLRGKGHYSWSLIEHFSTVEYGDPTVEKLVLHFEKYTDEDFDITSLDKKKIEIIELMLAYKGSSAVYYAGHKKQ